MNPWLVEIAITMVVSCAAMWLIVRPSTPKPHVVGREDSVALGRPASWKWLGVVGTVSTLVVGGQRVLTEPDPDQAMGFALITVLGIATGAFIFIVARREIVFSREGIREVGVSAVRAIAALPEMFISWQDLDTIEVPEGSPLGVMRFKSRAGRRLVVDATMTGWQALVKQLPHLCAVEARDKIMTALAQLPPPPEP